MICKIQYVDHIKLRIDWYVFYGYAMKLVFDKHHGLNPIHQNQCKWSTNSGSGFSQHLPTVGCCIEVRRKHNYAKEKLNKGGYKEADEE